MDTPQIEHIDNLVAALLLPDAVSLPASMALEATDEFGCRLEAGSTLVTETTTKSKGKKYEVEYIAAQDDDSFLIE